MRWRVMDSRPAWGGEVGSARRARRLFAGLVVALLAIAVPGLATPALGASLGLPDIGYLRLVEELPGQILDVDGTRMLFVDESVTPKALRVKHRGTGFIETVSTAGSYVVGYLSPAGAIFTTGSDMVTTGHLFDWRPTQTVDLGPVWPASVRVSGRWAIWNRDRTLVARDLQLGTDRVVATYPSPTNPPIITGSDVPVGDVATNGDVVYGPLDGDLWRDRLGVKTLIAEPIVGSVGQDPHGPLTDGVDVLYDSWYYAIYRYGGGGQTESLSIRGNGGAGPRGDYALNGGWAAFTDMNADWSLDVWSRAPDGTMVRRAPDGTIVPRVWSYSWIVGLNPAGDILLNTATTVDPFLGGRGGRLVLLRTNGPALDLGESDVRYKYEYGCESWSHGWCVSGFRPATDWATWADGAWWVVEGGRLSTIGIASQTRLAGADRYATAVAISQATFPNPGVPVVYVATGRNFPDALAGGPAAAKAGGPVLLVDTNAVPAVVATELTRLAPAAIRVLGGPGAVSDAVLAQLDAYTSGPVTRLAGADRYATGAAVVGAAFAGHTGSVFIASGANFPDALAGGPVAANEGSPIVLARADRLPPASLAALRAMTPTSFILLGGTGVLSAGVFDQLHALYPNAAIGRWSGPDRYATSATIAANAFPAEAETVFIATGANYPDALAGVPAAAELGAPLLLARQTCLPQAVFDRFRGLGPSHVVLLGGSGVLGDSVASNPCGG